jgi:hypothetical protein
VGIPLFVQSPIGIDDLWSNPRVLIAVSYAGALLHNMFKGLVKRDDKSS